MTAYLEMSYSDPLCSRLSGAQSLGPQAPENPMGPLWNFAWGPNRRISNVFQWRHPPKFAWGPWKFTLWGPSGPQKNVYQEPCCWMKIVVFWFKFHQSTFLRIQLTINKNCFGQIMVWHWTEDKPLFWTNGDPVYWCCGDAYLYVYRRNPL